ncbi:hypothetical protein L7F22_067630 [Adiantum nelumboides]|nr:hypothetical protein [Adiantum nelumboides]
MEASPQKETAQHMDKVAEEKQTRGEQHQPTKVDVPILMVQNEEPTSQKAILEVRSFDYTKLIQTLSRQFQCQQVMAKETEIQRTRINQAQKEMVNLRTALELVTKERDSSARENENFLIDLMDLQSQLTRKEAQNHELIKNEKKMKEQIKYEDARYQKLNTFYNTVKNTLTALLQNQEPIAEAPSTSDSAALNTLAALQAELQTEKLQRQLFVSGFMSQTAQHEAMVKQIEEELAKAKAALQAVCCFASTSHIQQAETHEPIQPPQLPEMPEFQGTEEEEQQRPAPRALDIREEIEQEIEDLPEEPAKEYLLYEKKIMQSTALTFLQPYEQWQRARNLSSSAFHRAQPEAVHLHLSKRSKKRPDGRSSFGILPSISGSSDFHRGGKLKYNAEYCADTAPTSTSSFCSRLGAGYHVSGSSASGAGHFERDLPGRNSRADSHELALSFSVPELEQLDAPDAVEATAGFRNTNQYPQINLALETSPEAKEPLLDRRLEAFGTEFSDLSSLPDIPASVEINGYRTLPIDVHHPSSVSVAATNSASSTLTALLSHDERSIFYPKSGGANDSKEGLDISSSIPSSPTLMFKQILKDPSWGLTPLIEAETSKCEKFHFANSSDDFDDMLNKLHEREGDVPLLWGYLDRSHITGIYEPHRYFIVVWQIQHASKYNYELETLFRAVSLLDRCLCYGTTINRQRLWLLGVACMCMAAKLEETRFSSIICVMEDVCTEIGQKPCFKKEQLIWMETIVLQVVNYECLTPTAATFIWHYLWDFRKDREVQILAFYILCLSLTDYELLRFPASVISASAVFLTCVILNRVMELHWTKPAVYCNCVKRLDFLFAEASGMRRYTSDF